MGKALPLPPPDPTAFMQKPMIVVEAKISIPRVMRCESCAAPLKGNVCQHCGSEHT